MNLIVYICTMNFWKKLFKPKQTIYPYKILEMDNEDAILTFSDGKLDYVIELEYEDGVLDIEFGVLDSETHDTTNLNNQFNIMRTVAYATRRTSDNLRRKYAMVFHTVTFKSSNWRNGDIDFKSADIRNRFFFRYVKRQFPNAEIIKSQNNITTIKLNRV